MTLSDEDIRKILRRYIVNYNKCIKNIIFKKDIHAHKNIQNYNSKIVLNFVNGDEIMIDFNNRNKNKNKSIYDYFDIKTMMSYCVYLHYLKGYLINDYFLKIDSQTSLASVKLNSSIFKLSKNISLEEKSVVRLSQDDFDKKYGNMYDEIYEKLKDLSFKMFGQVSVLIDEIMADDYENKKIDNNKIDDYRKSEKKSEDIHETEKVKKEEFVKVDDGLGIVGQDEGKRIDSQNVPNTDDKNQLYVKFE